MKTFTFYFYILLMLIFLCSQKIDKSKANLMIHLGHLSIKIYSAVLRRKKEYLVF